MLVLSRNTKRSRSAAKHTNPIKMCADDDDEGDAPAPVHLTDLTTYCTVLPDYCTFAKGTNTKILYDDKEKPK